MILIWSHQTRCILKKANLVPMIKKALIDVQLKPGCQSLCDLDLNSCRKSEPNKLYLVQANVDRSSAMCFFVKI